MLWYHMKHRLLLNKERSLFLRIYLPWQQESPEKKLLIFQKQAHWLPFFIARKWSEGQDRTLCTADSEPPYSVIPQYRIFLKLQNFILAFWLLSGNKKWGTAKNIAFTVRKMNSELTENAVLCRHFPVFSKRIIWRFPSVFWPLNASICSIILQFSFTVNSWKQAFTDFNQAG